MARILTTDEFTAERREADGEVTDDMARTIASWWHGGSDHNITALSHGCEWSTAGILEEIGALMRNPHHEDEGGTLPLLRAWVDEQWITAVQTSHGHRFMGDDGYESCLTCGGQWELAHDRADYPRHGRYRTWNGDDATECTYDTSMVHGEAPCEECGGEDESCEHCRHDCNCMICTG